MSEWTADQIKVELAAKDIWVTKAVSAIFNYQTDTEQCAEETHEDNGVGFNAVDASILSSFAKQIDRWNTDVNKRFPHPLSPRQMEIARKKIKKYAGQLAKIANGVV